MTTDWSTRLGASPFHDSAARHPLEPQVSPPVDMIIGIDFGTRFTKVAVSDGRQRQVWIDDSGTKLIPSIVYIASDGTVVSYPSPESPGSEKIEYLKMLLPESSDRVFRSVRQNVYGRAIEDITRPLAAAFLSGVIRHVRASIIRRRPDLKQRRVNWFVNVGVPVQHYDANADGFSEVAAVAFHWAQRNHMEYTIDDLSSSYAEIVGSLDLDRESSPAQVVPELTAAIHELIRDPNREDALYGLFDIGGGTLDGAIFHVNRSGIGRPLRIHAARVDQCGTIAVSRMMVAEIYSRLPHYIEGALVGTHVIPTVRLPLTELLKFRDDKSVEVLVQNVVGGVIQTTRTQLYGQMFSPRVDATARDTPPLRVLIAGGGAPSAWYKSAIERTFLTRNLSQFGLTGIRSEIISKPADYRGDDFPRFVIALGLADSVVALADAQLPSQFRNAEPPLERGSPPAPITKDMV
jgi:hypothetical protein